MLRMDDPVDQGRQHTVRPDSGFDPRPILCGQNGLCIVRSRLRHSRCFRMAIVCRHASTFLPCLPSSRFVLPGLRARPSGPRFGTMRALTPAAVAHVGRSLRFLCSAVRTSRPQPHSAARGHTGFATHERARLCKTPKRVRHPAGRSFASGCSPPRIAATQLPPATQVHDLLGLDLHQTDKATSRTHSWPALCRPPIVPQLKRLNMLKNGWPGQARP